jgi:hypothetical protein
MAVHVSLLFRDEVFFSEAGLAKYRTECAIWDLALCHWNNDCFGARAKFPVTTFLRHKYKFVSEQYSRDVF